MNGEKGFFLKRAGRLARLAPFVPVVVNADASENRPRAKRDPMGLGAIFEIDLRSRLMAAASPASAQNQPSRTDLATPVPGG
jgi:hypothetical protein